LPGPVPHRTAEGRAEVKRAARAARLLEYGPDAVRGQLQDRGHRGKVPLPEVGLPGELTGTAQPGLPLRLFFEPDLGIRGEVLPLAQGVIAREKFREEEADRPAVEQDVMDDQDQRVPVTSVRGEYEAQRRGGAQIKFRLSRLRSQSPDVSLEIILMASVQALLQQRLVRVKHAPLDFPAGLGEDGAQALVPPYHAVQCRDQPAKIQRAVDRAGEHQVIGEGADDLFAHPHPALHGRRLRACRRRERLRGRAASPRRLRRRGRAGQGGREDRIKRRVTQQGTELQHHAQLITGHGRQRYRLNRIAPQPDEAGSSEQPRPLGCSLPGQYRGGERFQLLPPSVIDRCGHGCSPGIVTVASLGAGCGCGGPARSGSLDSETAAKRLSICHRTSSEHSSPEK